MGNGILAVDLFTEYRHFLGISDLTCSCRFRIKPEDDFISDTDKKGELFQITDNGYNFIDGQKSSKYFLNICLRVEEYHAKKGHMFTDEYFERQLQSIREIRLSERKFYQKITDLYSTAFDYDKDAKTTRRFFQTCLCTLIMQSYRRSDRFP